MERGVAMKYLIKYFIDFAVLVLLYLFIFFKKWRIKGRDRLLVNTLMYAYLSLVLFFTMMPVITSIPFILDHPYKPMNLVPFIDVTLGRGDFFQASGLECCHDSALRFPVSFDPGQKGKNRLNGVFLLFDEPGY